MNKSGLISHTWSSNYMPGEGVYMLEDGTLFRTIKLSFFGSGAGGGIQKISWNGSLMWNFTYYTNNYLSHHDIELLPNGNILTIAWEYKTRNEAIEKGRDPNRLQGNILMPDHIIEVKPTGPSSGNIIWEWHVWDHIIQDYDPLKPNYGVVSDHPELIDINFGSAEADWMHTNSIDYNEKFDQILISVHNFNEIWVIDHSTTKEEAATHTGGNSGKGGDLLYRWGNPRAYGRGSTGDQKFFSQHDASWIDNKCLGEGNILIFNNGVDRPGGQYSSVDEIVPPVDDNGNYSIEPGYPYGPEGQIWIYTAENPADFYSYYVGGAQRLSNGNTLICDGANGIFFEVTLENDKIWEFINPFPNYINNDVFKIQYIPSQVLPGESDLDCEGSLDWSSIDPGSTVTGSFKVKNIGTPGSELDWEVQWVPKWGDWLISPASGEDLTTEDGPVIVQVTCIAPDEKNEELKGSIRIRNSENNSDYDEIPVSLTLPKNKPFNFGANISSWLLEHFPNAFPILKHLIGINQRISN